MNEQLQIKKTLTLYENRGFALISTIIIMSLLAVITLGLLSLSSQHSASVNVSQNELRAQANARLALSIAISRLQEELGPDQRISARSGILAKDASGNSPSDKGFNGSTTDASFAQSHLLGSWNSWTTWNTEPSFLDTYQGIGRKNNFRSWLVSHPNRSELANIDFAKAQYDGETVELVGDGTLGSLGEPGDRVKAPVVKITANNGAYAWQAFGENQKGCISLVSEISDDSIGSDGLEIANGWSSNIKSLGDGFDSASEEKEKLAKIVSLRNGELLSQDGVFRDTIRSHYHDFTDVAMGLPVDLRKGGLKKDLNALLEMEKMPNEYGSGDSPQPIRAKDGHFDSTFYGDLTINFQSWYRMHQYYQAYKGDDAYLNENESSQLVGNFKKGVQFSSDRMNANFNWHSGNLDRYGLARTPVIASLNFELGIRKKPVVGKPDKTDFTMSFQPVIKLWNPYNVNLTVPKLQTNSIPGSLEYKVYVNGTMTKDWSQVRRSDSGGNLFNLYTMAGKGKGFTPMEFKPGEVRIYSAAPDALTSGNNSNVELYPGYEPLGNGGGFDITLPGLTELDKNSNVELAVRLTSRRYSAAGDGVGQGHGHHNGAFQFYWSTWAQRNPDMRFTELGVSSVEDGQPIMLIEDSAGERLQFSATTATQRVSFGSYGYELKTEDLYEDVPYYGSKLLRGKNVALSNPTNQRAMFGQASDRVKAMSQYQLRVRSGVGGAVSPDFTPENYGYYGATHSAQSASGNLGQNFVTMSEISLSPATSLAGLGLFPLKPGFTDYPTSQHLWDISTNSLLGIGNSLAHPLIPGDKVYNDIPDAIAGDPTSTDGLNNPNTNRQMKLIRDFHDNTFYINDAIYDEWFMSGITHQNTVAFDTKRDIAKVFKDFASGDKPLANGLYEFRHELKTESEKLTEGSKLADDTYRNVAKYLSLRGSFNVNSVSVDAWRELFYGLRKSEIHISDPESGSVDDKQLGEGVLISRFNTPASIGEASDAGDPNAWTGVRYLTDKQVDRLARECVRQVKLRGPFLNMSDFVNRRLENSELGVCGAIQAAIDYDEYNGNTPSKASEESINARFKSDTDLITTAHLNTWSDNPSLAGDQKEVAFEEAFIGSRWTAIPGYVMQADILKRIGNKLTVRDDTFRLRVYGDARDATGKIVARAWAEAVIVRKHDYVDAKRDDELRNAESLTSDTNRSYGRKMEVLSFRWLSADEI